MIHKILSLVKRRPAAAYFLLTFAISWGGVFLVGGGPDGFPADSEQIEQLLPLVVLTLTAGPVLAGLLLTVLVDGWPGLRNFFIQASQWQVSPRWYAIALLLTPTLAALTLFALSLFSPMFFPGILTAEDRPALLLSAVSAGLAGGLLEEPGWTWFATPRLRQRYSVFSTGLVLGLLWGAWHFIVAVWGSGTPSGDFSLLLFLPQDFFYAGVLPAFRVLMVWVYENTHSLLIIMLMHASLTGSVLFIFMPAAIPELQLLTWYIILAVVLWGTVAVICKGKGLKWMPGHNE